MHRCGFVRCRRPGVRRSTCSITVLPTLSFPYDVFVGAPTVTSGIARDSPAPAAAACRHSPWAWTIGDVRADLGAADGAAGRWQHGQAQLQHLQGWRVSRTCGRWRGTTPLIVIDRGANTPGAGLARSIRQDAPVGNYRDTVIMSVNP
jgi:hypothetical protein